MRALVIGCVLAVSACATVKSEQPGDLASRGRIYDFDLAETQKVVREVFAKRGIALLPTDDPAILRTEPIDRVTHDLSGEKVAETIEHQQTWAVVFQPVGAHGTTVRIVRADQFSWQDQAEREMPYDLFGRVVSDPVHVNPDHPLHFIRDFDKEAMVAAALDGQVDVQVTPDGPIEPKRVAPLEDPTVALETSAPTTCGLDGTDLAEKLVPGHLVLMSDPIGAREPWAVLTEVLCVARGKGLAVTVALAIPSSEQLAVNRYLASEGTEPDRRTFLATSFWDREWQDGRSSEATLGAIEHLRQQRKAGAKFTVLAVEVNLAGNPHQAHVAAALLKHRDENPQRAIVAMLGNSMTTMRKGAEWDATLLPVGARLASVLPESTHSYDVAFQAGSHWTCRAHGDGKLRCGTWTARPGPPQTLQTLTAKPFFRTFSSVSKEGFSGVYYVGGKLTPSLPAVASRRVDEGITEVRINSLDFQAPTTGAEMH